MDLIEVGKTIADAGWKVGLALLVYILAKDAVRTRVALIECLQSGGKISDKSLDAMDDIG